MTPTPTPEVVVPRDTVASALDRFREALCLVPDVEGRHNVGQQFNAYDLDDEGDRKAVCIGSITSRPLSLVEAPNDVATLIEAALRLGSACLAASPQPVVAPSDLSGEVTGHRFGSPPEPVVNPSSDWCNAYADWYYQEPSA